MKTPLVLATMIALIALQPALAENPKPSEQSVRQLFAAMHTGESIKAAFARTEDMLRASMNEPGARPLNPEQQKIREQMRARVVALMKQQFDWATIEPLMVESYRNTFTPQEVDALLRFYQTPIGRSVGAKLPATTQQMAQLMQQRIREIMPKIQEIVRDSRARMEAAGRAPDEPPQSGTMSQQPHG